mgnify:FL=1
MKKLLLVIAIVCSLMCVSTPVFAEENTTNVASVDSDKAKSAAFVVGISSACAAIAMGWAISKSTESISRQPEAEGPIRTALMLGLVFIETVVIYALIVAILVIFVL